jgi:glycosyltransferase involved in cell wall biosynthesis
VLPHGAGTHAVNAVARLSFPSDVVVVTPGIRVTGRWLERLQTAATSDSTVASATPLSLGAGTLELFEGDRSDNAGSGADSAEAASRRVIVHEAPASVEEAAHRVSERALNLRPRIATMGPGCVYIRRAALELAGALEESLPLDRALADLAARMTALGMIHVVADDVLVEGLQNLREQADEPDVHPAQTDDSLQETIANDERGPLRRAISRGRTALRKSSVTIDGRALRPTVGGTQTYIVELIAALARLDQVSIRVVIPPDLSERAGDTLASLAGVELLSYEQAVDNPRQTDVVHRPQQVFTPEDLALLRLVGERIVIGQQDLIAYHNHTYHRDIDAWRAYRRTTWLALAGADQAIFFSEHARRDALAEDLLPEGRTHVVGIGAETLETPDSPAVRPEGVEAEDEFLLCLGADYAHKNRPFAIELLRALRERGWTGRLVLAGPHVPYGSSRERELELLGNSPELAELVVDLGPVDEPSKRWLYAHARALVYPTIYEGFGLLPLEAARAGLPCLFAAQASLAELAGGAVTLTPWDANVSAEAVLPLLGDGQARDSHLAILRGLAIPSWDEVARQLVGVYEHAIAAPSSKAAPRAWQELDRERYIVRLDQDVQNLKQTAQEYQDAYHALESRVETGLALIDDEGGLLTRAQQRGLMRVAGRGRLGALALAPFGLLGRLRGGGRRPGVEDPRAEEADG